MWPSLLLIDVNWADNIALNAWSHSYIMDEKSCLALFFGALCHKRSNLQSSPETRGLISRDDEESLLLLEMESARIIKQALQEQSYQPTDTLILGALCMANNSSLETRIASQDESPFKPPLCHLQWLDFYGAKALRDTYHMGLFQLIQLKGGLDQIEMPGLAGIISL